MCKVGRWKYGLFGTKLFGILLYCGVKSICIMKGFNVEYEDSFGNVQ